MSGIDLFTNFTVNTALPLDDRDVVANLTARDAIPALRRYQGMKVYVSAEGKAYRLIGGITNTDWSEEGGSGGGGGPFQWSATTQAISAGGQITLTLAQIKQAITVVGDGGPATLNVDLFSSEPDDGTTIVLVGTSDTNYVVVPYSDTDGGALVNGDIILFKDSVCVLLWNDLLKRYFYIGGRQ